LADFQETAKKDTVTILKYQTIITIKPLLTIKINHYLFTCFRNN